MMAKNVAKNKVPAYDSNPFTISFSAFAKFAKYATGWLIALVILDTLNFFSNFGGTYESETPNFDFLSGIPPIVIVLLFVLVIIVSFVLFVFFNGVLAYTALRSLEGKQTSLKTAFNETKARFVPLSGALVNSMLRIFGGLLLFIIPGIRAAMRYTVVAYIVMSTDAQQAKEQDAVARAKEITKHRLIEVFGMFTVGALVPFITSSLTTVAAAAIHNQLAEYHDKGLEKPKVHWLNYIGFGLLLLFGAIITLFIFVIFTVGTA